MENEKFSFPADHPKPPPLSVSSNYEELELSRLGEGVFGTVSRFLKKDTSQIVAVKRLKDESFDVKKEISILERLRSFGAHKCHIVQFLEHFQRDGHTCLVFEALDISLYDYMRQRDFVPLSLYDIRWIIKQLAVAFDTLKTMGLIHTDVKPDNIMLVDHEKKPLRVKLIDFGLAIPTCEAEQGARLQPQYWRSPEILLGLQFSEAIDMWSLGCVMAEMLLGYPLFPGQCEYDVMRFIVQLLGPPPEHLLNAGLRTKKFFKKPFFSFRRHWRLMTPAEYRRVGVPGRDTRRYDFRSLVQLKERLANQNRAEADDMRDCVDLIKALLETSPNCRITPGEVLGHPFIARLDHPRRTRPQPRRMKLETAKSKSRPRAASPTPQPAVILVQPAPVMDHMLADAAFDQQTSPQVDVNVSSSEEGLSKPEPTEAINDDHTDVTLLEALGKLEVADAINEATTSVNTTEVGAATSADVDSGVGSACAPLTSPAGAPDSDLGQAAADNTQSPPSTPDVRQPEKKKKKKTSAVRRYFSRLVRVFRGVNNRVHVE